MPEYGALIALTSAQSQATWMRLLRSLLADCFDPGLAIQMKELEVGRRGVRQVKIDDIGTSQSRTDLAVKVTTGEGTNSVPLRTEWTYSGPVFRCFPDLPIRVKCCLEAVEERESVQFRFVLLNHETEMDDALRRFIDILDERLNLSEDEDRHPDDCPAPFIPVYHGTPELVRGGEHVDD